MRNELVATHLQYQCDTGRGLFKDLSFTVPAGSLLHVVGLNGVGKTTLLRMVAGLLPLQGTRARVFWPGAPLGLCYLGHAIAVKPALSVRENLLYDYHLLGTCPEHMTEALRRVNLLRDQHQFAGLLSRGQKQRIVLAKLICSTAILYVLDEPLTALDKEGTMLAEDIIGEKLAQQSMVIMTSHDPLSHSLLRSKIRTLCLERLECLEQACRG